jgi:Spy/CpxP family protein refolding chaperone
MFRQLNSLLLLMTTSGSPFSTAALYLAAGAWQTVEKEFYRMKRSLVGAVLSLAMACGATALYAQQDTMSQGAPQNHHTMSADQRLQHMTRMLNLTSDQQEKIKPILENEQTQMQSLHQDSSLAPADRRSKMQELRQNTNQQINGVLTPDQQQKWSQMQEHRHEHMGHGAGAGAGAGQAQPQQAPQQ